MIDVLLVVVWAVIALAVATIVLIIKAMFRTFDALAANVTGAMRKIEHTVGSHLDALGAVVNEHSTSIGVAVAARTESREAWRNASKESDARTDALMDRVLNLRE